MEGKKMGRTYMSLAMLLVAGFMLLAAGCSKQKKEEKPAEPEKPAITEYKIGAILSVSGPASFLGDPEKKTLDMLVEKLNADGGINGVPVKLIVEDDEGKEEKTKLAASKLVDMDQVLAVIGPSLSGNSMAIKDMMEEKQTTLVSCAAAEAIVNPVAKWVFKTPQKDSFVAEHILKYMQENGVAKIAVLYSNDGFGQQGLKQIKDTMAKYNVEVIMEETYTKESTEDDIATILTKVKSNKSVQAIINWTILPLQSVVPKKMKELQMDKIKLFHSHGFGNIKYVQNAGDAANGIIFPAGRLLVAEELPEDNPQKAGLMSYKQQYEERFGEDVSTFGGHAYDAFWIIVKAIEKAGADKAAIRDAIETMSGFAGTGGIFNMTAEDHNGLGLDSIEMLTVKDGKFALLVPPAAAAPAEQ